MTLGECVRVVAPYYNLALIAIVIILFIKLFMKKRKVFLLPWKLLFAAVIIYVVEQVMTVLKFAGLITYPIIFNSFMEMAIITLFVYMLLVEKEHLQKKPKKRKRRIR